LDPQKKRIKIDLHHENFQKNSRYTLSDHKRNKEISEKFEVEPADEKLRIYKIKLATKCNKNEQQQDDKSNAEL